MGLYLLARTLSLLLILARREYTLLTAAHLLMGTPAIDCCWAGSSSALSPDAWDADQGNSRAVGLPDREAEALPSKRLGSVLLATLPE
jgi:hypothetical protein